MEANLENSAVATGWEKVIFILIPNNVQITIQVYSFHMLAR